MEILLTHNKSKTISPLLVQYPTCLPQILEMCNLCLHQIHMVSASVAFTLYLPFSDSPDICCYLIHMISASVRYTNIRLHQIQAICASIRYTQYLPPSHTQNICLHQTSAISTYQIHAISASTDTCNIYIRCTQYLPLSDTCNIYILQIAD